MKYNFDEIFSDEIYLHILSFLSIEDLIKACRLPHVNRLVRDKYWWMNCKTYLHRREALKYGLKHNIQWIKDLMIHENVCKFIHLFPPLTHPIQNSNDCLALCIQHGLWWMYDPLIDVWKANPNYVEESGPPWDRETRPMAVFAAECAVNLNDSRILIQLLKHKPNIMIESEGSIPPFTVWGALKCYSEYDECMWSTKGVCNCHPQPSKEIIKMRRYLIIGR